MLVIAHRILQLPKVFWRQSLESRENHEHQVSYRIFDCKARTSSRSEFCVMLLFHAKEFSLQREASINPSDIKAPQTNGLCAKPFILTTCQWRRETSLWPWL
jgi:hypothetical protein